MTNSFTITRTNINDTWSSGEVDEHQTHEVHLPQLRLLSHLDLDRIGAYAQPSELLSSGEWVTVGRKGPLFAVPGEIPRPLDDPAISRAQFRVRWRAEVQRFEVEPFAGARRALRVMDLQPHKESHSQGPGQVLRSRVLLDPGTCLAVGKRILFGFEVISQHRALDEDRMGLVGECETLWRVRDNIRAVCRFKKPVFILGETGSGKELVARAIHQYGPRAAGPYHAVNCAALPEHLVESLLFGHKKGAFTGAHTQEQGTFRAADKGTLFLDEIGELPLTIQPKLLRTLQEGTVTAVGGYQSLPVDVRLVAATHRTPELEIDEGRLRHDLYYRLAAHILRVPPLRERRFDIPALFVFFLRRIRDEHRELNWLWKGTEEWQRKIPLRFFVALMRRNWSGNVRELENMAEHIASKNLVATRFQFPQWESSSPVTTAPEPTPDQAPSPSAQESQGGEWLGEASNRLNLAHKTIAKLLGEKELREIGERNGEEALTAALQSAVAQRLFELLRTHSFKQQRVAGHLGVSLSTLVKLMRRFGLPRPRDLSLEEIERAMEHADGDVSAAAFALKVSEHGLKKRITLLKIKKKG